MTKTIHGKAHGRIIELDEDLGVAEGQEVEVRVTTAADGPQEFREICQDLHAESQVVAKYLIGNMVAEEGAGAVAEIQSLLERLYDCRFGQGESLKSIVVLLQSQLNNANWTSPHVDLLRLTDDLLRTRNVPDDQTVAEVGDLIEECGLNPFRGSVADNGLVARYRIEKIETE
jgi:hypothetical protein